MRVTEKKKIKILTISDHPLSPSGVGTQTKYILEKLLNTGKYSVISLGGAVKHEKYQPQKTKEFEDDWIIFPVDGYGNPDLVRAMIRNHRPDMLWFMTDPRFFGWLWDIEDEIRAHVPMIYYHVWDNIPYPKFNKGFVRQMAYSVWDIIPITSPKLDEKHVAPYPEEIPRRLIRLFSFKGDTVLDPFAGAGTTNKVAKQLGRKSIGVEMSKEYCKLIKAKVSSVKFNSVGDEIFDHSGEYEIKIAKEKLEKAERDYKKTKKVYEELTKKRSKKSGIMKFT